jgi:hypothetical protein
LVSLKECGVGERRGAAITTHAIHTTERMRKRKMYGKFNDHISNDPFLIEKGEAQRIPLDLDTKSSF